MTGSPFQPPEDRAARGEPEVVRVAQDVDFEDSETLEEPGRSRTRLAVAAAGVAGLVVGALVTAAVLTVRPGEPPALGITPDVFPRTVLGLQRDDIDYRDRAVRQVVARLDDQFATQREQHARTYGGDGATLGYHVGRGGAWLTIVNGILPAELPRDGDGIFGYAGPVVWSTLESGDVTCTADVTHAIEFDDNSGQPIDGWDEGPVRGLTTCVLADQQRNLSLRLVRADRPSEIRQDATDFSAELRRIFARLVTEP